MAVPHKAKERITVLEKPRVGWGRRKKGEKRGEWGRQTVHAELGGKEEATGKPHSWLQTKGI